MGAVAENGADFTVVTSDNPREEPAGSIIKAILGGMKSSDLVVEEDRKKAIEIALRHASEDDVVLIAGKGHETTQEIEGEFLDFKDLEVVEGLIPELFGEGM